MKLSIIIPVFNEEKTVVQVIKQVSQVKITGAKIEVIIINDASTDKTAKKLQDSKGIYPNLKVITHAINMGKGAAVRTGFEKATGEYLVIQDADLEYDPIFIPQLFEPILAKEAEVVYGTRLKRLPHPQKEESTPRFFLHFFGNRFLSLITSILYGQWITDMETCYKIFPKAFVEKTTLLGSGFNFEPEITAKLIKSGYRIKEVPITTKPRGYKEGKKLQTFPEGFKALWTLIKFRFVD